MRVVLHGFGTFLSLINVISRSKGWDVASESRIPFTTYKLKQTGTVDLNSLDNFYRQLSSVSGYRYPFLKLTCDENKKRELNSGNLNFKPISEIFGSSHPTSASQMGQTKNVTDASAPSATYLREAKLFLTVIVEDLMTKQEVDESVFILMMDHISKSPNKTLFVYKDFLDSVRTNSVQNMGFTGMVLIPFSLLQYSLQQNDSLPMSGDMSSIEDKYSMEDAKIKLSPKELPRYITEVSTEESNILTQSRYIFVDQHLYRTTLNTTYKSNNEQDIGTILIRKVRFSKTLKEYFILNLVELALPSNVCHNKEDINRQFPIEEAGHIDIMTDHADKNDAIPSWFSEGVYFCFRWYHDRYLWQCDATGMNFVLCLAGKLALEYQYDYMASQCGENLISPLCVPVGQMTDPYRDDTDVRAGGCRMSWGIMSRKPAPVWFSLVELCFQWYSDTDGDAGQCGGDIDEMVCAKVGEYTPYYFDNTDERRGGCNMRWNLSVPTESPSWLLTLKLCFHYEADDRDIEQCNNGGDKTSFCVGVNSWTPYYRDDTNLGKGGCRLKWGLTF